MMVEPRVAAQASAKRERRRAGMSAANVGASLNQTNHKIVSLREYRRVTYLNVIVLPLTRDCGTILNVTGFSGYRILNIKKTDITNEKKIANFANKREN